MSLISILISLSIMTQTHSPPRCWIGVIDQITPPWLSVAGEHGETLLLSLDKSYSGAKEGDWVMFGRYAGSRFKIDGAEPRLLNDDEILAVIEDPRDIIAV